MRTIPAFCEKCGIITESGFGMIGQGATLSFQGCGTSCPRCGGNADILDGAYTNVGETISVVTSSPRTMTWLSQLQAASQAVKAAPGITSDAIDALNVVSPELGALAQSLSDKKFGKAILLAALLVISTKCSTDATPTVIDNRTFQEINNITIVYHDGNEVGGNQSGGGPDAPTEGSEHSDN
jgi:hypothetical protein